MLSKVKNRIFWIPPLFALMAIAPLVSTLKPDANSILGMLAFAVLAVWSFLLGRQRRTIGAAQTRSEERAQSFISDFEDRGLGWFWETGREGELTYISKSISLTLGKTQRELLGLKFASVLSESREHDKNRQWMTLEFHLSSRTAFTDLPFQSSVNENRYWSISGSPVYDQLGNYRGFRGNGLDLSEKRESERTLTQLARCDPLTGLANRLEIHQTLENALLGPDSQPSACSLFLLDLDKFKPVNDTMGHPVGDRYLKIAGQVILDAIGDKGQVGRVGGDEFLVVVPAITDREDLKLMANQVIENLGKPRFIEGKSVAVGASVGIAIYQADTETIDPKTLVRNADLALYAAKKSGGGVCHFYEPAMLREAADEREFEEDLRQALVKGELSLAYQPIVETSDRTLCGFEAMISWNHPSKGHINPEKIIKTAEDINIISQIGDWTVRTACSQLKSWKTDLPVAVKISPDHFAGGTLATCAVGAIAASGIRPEQLELNISKGAFLEENLNNIKTFNQLRISGVRLVFDKFGTGYSALGYLRQFRFDKLRIDQSFVRIAGQDGRMNSAIISSIVTLARALKIETTADGVKTPEELEFVRRLGCSQAQGNIFGKPMRPEEVTALLNSSETRISASYFTKYREKRRKILHRVKLYYRDCWHDAMIKNISRNGAMFEGLENVEEGSRLEIDFCNGRTVQATCIWSSGKQMGVRFEEPATAMVLGPVLRSDFGYPEAQAS